MKISLLLSSLILTIMLMAGPQTLSAQKYGDIATDTVNASENLIRYVGGTSATNCEYFPYPHDFVLAVKGDSLSGSTNTNVILEGAYANDPTAWVPLDTININGAASNHKGIFISAERAAARYRIRQTGSGTQATRVESEWWSRKRTNY